MNRTGMLTIACALLLAVFATGAEAQTTQTQKQQKIRKMDQVQTQKARPAKMPQKTTGKDRGSATGYHKNYDQDKPTQERPNPLDPVRDPARKPGNPLLH